MLRLLDEGWFIVYRAYTFELYHREHFLLVCGYVALQLYLQNTSHRWDSVFIYLFLSVGVNKIWTRVTFIENFAPEVCSLGIAQTNVCGYFHKLVAIWHSALTKRCTNAHIYGLLHSTSPQLVHVCPTAPGKELEMCTMRYTVTQWTNHSSCGCCSIFGEVHIRPMVRSKTVQRV